MSNPASTWLLSLDELCNEYARGLCALNAIHAAMEDGSFSAENFLDALLFVLSHMLDNQRNFRITIDSALVRTEPAQEGAHNE